MAKFSLRRYDVQAQVSVYLSVASTIFMAGLAALIFRYPRLLLQEKVIPYNPNTRGLMIWGAGVLALALGIAGFGFGLSSAGQRRNDKPALSWIGFFIGAVTITLTAVLLYLFRSWGEPVITR